MTLLELPDAAACALLALLTRRDQLQLLALSRACVQSSLRRQFFARSTLDVPPSAAFAAQLLSTLTVRDAVTSASVADPSFEPLLVHLSRLQRLRIRAKHDEAQLSGELVPRGVTHLDLRFAFFESVETLAPLVQLRKLELAFSLAPDLSVIGGMSELEELNLWGAAVASVEFVAGTPKLKALNLRQTRELTDLEPLRSLSHLEELNVAEKKLRDIEWLRPLAATLKTLNARELEIDENPTESMASTPASHLVISELANLEKLEIQSSNILKSFGPIRALTKLRHLDIIGLDLEDIEGFDYFPQLETLSLDMDESSNWLGLRDLRNLKRLNQNGYFANLSPPVEAQVLHGMPCLHSLMGAVYLTEHIPLLHIRELSLHCFEASGEEDATAALWCVPNLETLRFAGVCNLKNVAKFAPQLTHLDLHLLGTTGQNERYSRSEAAEYFAPLVLLSSLKTLTIAGRCLIMDDDSTEAATTTRTPFWFLEHLLNMEDLYLAGQAIADLSPLSSMKNLRRLNLESTCVHDITPLQQLLALEELDLGDTPVVNVEPLVGHPRLRLLTLPSAAVCRPLLTTYGVTLPSIKQILHPKFNCLWTQHQENVVDVSSLFEDEA